MLGNTMQHSSHLVNLLSESVVNGFKHLQIPEQSKVHNGVLNFLSITLLQRALVKCTLDQVIITKKSSMEAQLIQIYFSKIATEVTMYTVFGLESIRQLKILDQLIRLWLVKTSSRYLDTKVKFKKLMFL